MIFIQSWLEIGWSRKGDMLQGLDYLMLDIPDKPRTIKRGTGMIAELLNC